MVKPPKATIYQGAECRGVVLESSSLPKSENFAYYNLSTHSLASFRHCMIHPCSYVSGNNRAAPTGWAYGGA